VSERVPEHGSRDRFAALGEIAAEIAHELRNVLQIISASAYLARLDPPGSAAHVAKIERHARIAHGIVDDLMSLARDEPANATPVPLAEIVAAARAEIAPDGTSDPAAWDDAIDPPELRVRAHPGLLTRVMHVLYDNAIRVSAPRAPRITTRARHDRSAGRTVIEVEDDGPGVAEDLAPRIFDALVTGREGGTGLGLALAKRILDAHGGSITLLRRAPAGSTTGACFRLELPAT
jgi:signal transduction histidine kinase